MSGLHHRRPGALTTADRGPIFPPFSLSDRFRLVDGMIKRVSLRLSNSVTDGAVVPESEPPPGQRGSFMEVS